MSRAAEVDIPLDRDVFLRTLVRELATSLEAVIGPQEASGYISLVGQSVGTQINDSYIRALGIDRLSREQVSETDAGSSGGREYFDDSALAHKGAIPA